jgi:hypothetical protein
MQRNSSSRIFRELHERRMGIIESMSMFVKGFLTGVGVRIMSYVSVRFNSTD